MDHRFLRGGLPPFYLAPDYPKKDYQEWLEAFWAKAGSTFVRTTAPLPENRTDRPFTSKTYRNLLPIYKELIF